MKNNCILLIIVILSLLSCKKQNPFVRQEQMNGYTVTHFDISGQHFAQAPLKLSELIKNVKVIPLETSKEGLIDASAEYYIGRSFILVFQEENVLLFDMGGHFIRTVARQGKAPSEFGEIRDYCVDEENELLFVLDKWAPSGLKSFHLKDSAYLKPIETVVAVNNTVEYLDNGNLLLAPFPYGDVKYYCYQQTVDGELKSDLPYRSNRENRPVFKRLTYKVNDELRYLSSEHMLSDDTVFNISTTQLQPTWIFHCNTTKHYKVLGETPDYLFFEFNVLKSSDESEAKGGNGTVVALDYDFHVFCYDKRNGELEAIEGIQDDLFTGKIWSPQYDIRMQNGNVLCLTVPAMALLQDSEKKAVVKHPEVWQNIMTKLTEEDNPVLIIGDMN